MILCVGKGEDKMHTLDIDKLIMYKSIIHHNLYNDGIFIKCEHDTILYVQFDYDTIMLNVDDYQKSWYVKNYSGYQISGSKVLDSSRDFEKTFLFSTVSQIKDKLHEIENEIYNLPDIGYASNMNKIAKQKGCLEAQKSSLVTMQWHPYFARIDLIESNNPENGVSYYLTGNKDNQRINATSIIQLDNIIDWRSEEAAPYYDQEMYSNDECENKLVLLRDYEIKNKQLVSFADNLKSDKELIDQVADERLKKHIQINRDNHIKNIIQTIRTNQYRIISHNQNRNILVQGCAGSGKTMILAHRLTFWLFRLKNHLNISDSYIVSPTKLLSFEMTKLDLNIKEANFMSNFEFNKFLIEYICKELDIEANLANYYHSNNRIADTIIKNAYSPRIIDDYKNIVGILEEKEDKDVYYEFIEYANDLLNDEYNVLYKSKKQITREEQQNHEKIYLEILKLLESISYIDITSFKTKLEKSNKQFIELENQLKNINKQIKEIKTKYESELNKVRLVHEYFHEKSLSEVKKILDDWKKELRLAKNECEEITQVLENYKVDYQEFDKLNTEKNEIEDKIAKSGFFSRRRLERNKREIQSKLDNVINEITINYSRYNIDIESNISEIEERIDRCKSIITKESTLFNYLNDVTLQYIDLLKDKMIYEDKFENIDKEQLDKNKKYIRLCTQLIKYPKLLSQDKNSKNDTVEIFNKLLELKIPNNKSINNFIAVFDQYLNSKMYLNLKNYYENDQAQSALMIMVDFAISQFKKNHKIDSNHYEFELFLKLYFLFDRENIRKIHHKWIFIDEFQDYSYWEIEIYRAMFRDTSFNYFGDMNQNINAKGLGIREFEILTNKKFDKFRIPENYRNAKEITDYVNERMNLNMYPIGLKGKVVECSLDCFFETIAKDNKPSTKAIVISNEEQQKLIKKYEDEFPLYFVGEDEVSIASNKINVLTPLLVKGLEFDVVCVLEKEMSNNEKYVSFTRALTELYVIKEEI